MFTSEAVKTAVLANEERLFASWCLGRPPGWTTDVRTKHLICIGFWLREELIKLGISEDDRRTQENYYHRWSRSEEDLFELAAVTLNDAAFGTVEQNRKPLRRWG